MGNPAQMQTQGTPTAVVNLAAIKARHRIGRDGDLPLPPETYGVNMPGLQTGEIFSPVEARYESLSVDGTKKAYQQLNAVLDGLASQVVQTMERIVPYLAKMQSLLSQRGADRKMILRKAGLPRWTQWAEGYAKNLGCSIRTIQRHIRQHREDQTHGASDHAAAAEKRVKGSGVSKPVKLTGRQQAALVKAQVAANDLVVALKSGGDWRSALVEYEKVAVTPVRLDAYLDALSPEPDWKVMLVKLVNALEPYRLPILVKDALDAAQELLGGKGKTEAVCTDPASPKLAACPPARNPAGEGREHDMPGPAYVPTAIAREGIVLHGTGNWEPVGKPRLREAA